MNEAMRFPQLAVIVPCYNVQDSCGKVISLLKQYPCFVIAVNDGSVDCTGEALAALDVAVITHPANRGKGSAIRSGLNYFLEKGNWDYVATVDADGQHDPRELPAMMELLQKEEIDLLIGSRQFELRKMPWKRWIANKASSFIISQCLRIHVKDIQSGFRIYSKRIVKQIFPRIQSSGFEIETELLFLISRNQSVVREKPIQAIYNEQSAELSHWRGFHDSVRIAKTILRLLFKK